MDSFGEMARILRFVRPSIVALLVMAAFVGICLSVGPGYKWKARSFRRDFSKLSESAEIQKWGIRLLETSTAENETVFEVDHDQVPVGSNLELNPETMFPPTLLRHPDGVPNYVQLHRTGSPKNDYVAVTWGGGFGHWGLKIGRVQFRPSQEDPDYNLECQPGLYIWHEIH